MSEIDSGWRWGAPAEAVIDAAFAAMDHCVARTLGDGTMHEARKILTDAIDAFDKAVRQ